MRVQPFAACLAVIIMCVALALASCSSPDRSIRARQIKYDPASAAYALNALRNDINAQYGFRNGAPRINLGPCGRFARDFRERWNARFREPVTIVFLMSNRDTSNCYHVLVKLPDGNFFDGGNGVVTQQFLMALYSEMHVEEMMNFDFVLLDKRSYGLGRSYPECPNYSDEFTQQAIEKRLGALLNNGRAK